MLENLIVGETAFEFIQAWWTKKSKQISDQQQNDILEISKRASKVKELLAERSFKQLKFDHG
jgi:hypothetical protein